MVRIGTALLNGVEKVVWRYLAAAEFLNEAYCRKADGGIGNAH